MFLKLLLRRYRIPFAVFLFVALLGPVLLGSLDRHLARHNLRADAERMLEQIDTAVRRSEALLRELGAVSGFDCETQGVSQRLADEVFEEPAVRWLGLMRDKRVQCASAPLRRELQDYHFALKPLKDQFLIAALNEGQLRDVLLLGLDTENGRLVANIQPPDIDLITRAECEGCVDYILKLQGIEGFQFGRNELDEIPAEIHRVQVSAPQVDYELVLYAGKEFVDYYLGMGWFVSVLISLVCATVLAILVHALLSLRNSLRFVIQQGLNHGEFVPYYQPIVDSRTREVVGAEVLVRWKKPDGTMIPPGQFIPFAEESLLILPMTEQLLAQVARDLDRYRWRQGAFFASINLVPEHLDSDDLLVQLKSLLERYHLKPQNFSIELTERRQLANLSAASEALKAFTRLGIDAKIDDAGTGYGGFSYVQELPISTLKIDKMFVDTAVDGNLDVKRTVLEAIIEFAHHSELETIAEGVESESQVAYLQAHGVNLIQGYVYGRPMSAEDFDRWLKDF